MKKDLDEMTIEELKEAVEVYEMREKAFLKNIVDRNTEIANLRKRLDREGNRVNTLNGYEKALCRKKAEVARLKDKIVEKDDIIRGYESRERCNNTIIEKFKKDIKEKNDVIKDLTNELGVLCCQKNELKEQLQKTVDSWSVYTLREFLEHEGMVVVKKNEVVIWP